MNLGVDMWSRGIFNKHLVVIGFHLLVFLSIGVYVLFISRQGTVVAGIEV